jgi:hypothetical protein
MVKPPKVEKTNTQFPSFTINDFIMTYNFSIQNPTLWLIKLCFIGSLSTYNSRCFYLHISKPLPFINTFPKLTSTKHISPIHKKRITIHRGYTYAELQDKGKWTPVLQIGDDRGLHQTIPTFLKQRGTVNPEIFTAIKVVFSRPLNSVF